MNSLSCPQEEIYREGTQTLLETSATGFSQVLLIYYSDTFEAVR